MRSLVAFKLGAWVGIAIAAAFAKRAVPSRGDEESDELALVAILDGIEGSLTAPGGGVSTKGSDDPEAPLLTVDGVVLLGGVAVGSAG